MANNLKKMAAITAIAAASVLPIKSDARAPKKNKKTKTEIVINPAEIQRNINILSADSTNVANMARFTQEYNARIMDCGTASEILLEQITDVYKTMQKLRRDGKIDQATYVRITMMMHEMINFMNANTAADLVVSDYLKTGVKTTVPPYEINIELQKQRMLLQHVNQKKR